MHGWKFWDWVAYAGLFIAAIVLAADAAVKSSPTLAPAMPDWVKSEVWAFVPLLLLLLSSAILLTKVIRFKFSPASQRHASALPASSPIAPPPTVSPLGDSSGRIFDANASTTQGYVQRQDGDRNGADNGAFYRQVAKSDAK